MIIGIDPGLQGAVTFLNSNNCFQIKDLKNCIAETGNFRSLDPVLFQDFVDSTMPFDPSETTVFCEESILIPGNGIKTSRIVYDSRGVLRSVFLLRGVTLNWVAPVTWKSHFNLLKKTKEDSVLKILEYFPDCRELFYKNIRGNKETILDGRAESMLIALYGQHTLNQLF